MPAWVQQGYHEYAKRIHGKCALQLIEVAAERRGKNFDITKVMNRERDRLLRAIPAGNRIIALDRGGQSQSTLQIVNRMTEWMQQGECVALLIGSAEGLCPQLLEATDEIWSLSELTFAHPLARVLVAEQIYRCYSLIENLSYHR